MSSNQVLLPVGVWTQITTTDKQGSIRQQSGNTTVVYLESPTEPIGFSDTTPVMEETTKGESWLYFKVGTADFVWAFAITEDAAIVVTPGSD